MWCFALKMWIPYILSRSSRSQMFFKIDVLKHFANFTNKFHKETPALESVFNKIEKRDSNTGVFQWNVWKSSFYGKDFSGRNIWLLLLMKCCKIQWNNYFDSTNYLYIQRNNYFVWIYKRSRTQMHMVQAECW